jgi:GAF domain-containing protein
VFDTILANATKLCAAHFGMLALHEDGAFRSVAMHNVPQAFAEQRLSGPIRFAPKNPLGRLAVTKAVQHVVDVRTDPAFLDGDPGITALARLTGARTLLVVPMLKDDNLIGAFGIYRQEVRAFSDKQIDLVRNFANQAVIAIENTRLLNELRQRTNDLTESLEQQTATTEVLQIISSSSGDLEPVFAAMLEKGVRICGATFGNISRWDGEVMHHVATHNAPAAFAEARKLQAVNSTLDLETVLSTIVSKAAQLSGTEAGAIYVFDDPQREFRLHATYGMDQELIEALTHRHIDMSDPTIAALLTQDGYATLGRIGFEGRFDYAAIGAVPNLAARLCDEAKDGQILIDGKVKVAVEAAAQLEPLEELRLKGFHRPIKAFNVRAVSG